MPKSPRPQRSIRSKIDEAYNAATPEDIQAVRELISRARDANPSCEVRAITPGMAAIIFKDHNPQNRNWNEKDSEVYSEEMRNSNWVFTNQGIGFLKNATLGDGQYRLAAVALSGSTITMLIAFGMEPKSIIVIDRQRRRRAFETAQIGGIEDAKIKEEVLKKAYAYYARLYKADREQRDLYLIKNDRQVLELIQEHDGMLSTAIEIGDDSIRSIASPIFSRRESAAFAFLLMLAQWPRVKIVESLREFQVGEGSSDVAPLFVAASTLQREASRRDKRSLVSRFAITTKAFLQHVQGVKAVRPNSMIRSATDSPPDPTYPIVDEQAAA